MSIIEEPEVPSTPTSSNPSKTLFPDAPKGDLRSLFGITTAQQIVYKPITNDTLDHIDIPSNFLSTTKIVNAEEVLGNTNNERKLHMAMLRLEHLKKSKVQSSECNEPSNKKVKINEQFNTLSNSNKISERKNKPHLEDSGSDSESNQKIDRGPPITPEELEERDKRTVFVGNVPIGTNKKLLARLFAPYGEVESIRFRNASVLKPNSRKSCVYRGEFHPERKTLNAYVQYIDQGSVIPALKVDGALFQEHHLRVDSAIKRPLIQIDFLNCIYVSGLPFGAEEEDLYDLFKDCGEITKVRIIRDSYFKVARGYAYVQFLTRQAFYNALKLGTKLSYKGKTLHVRMATPNHIRKEDIPKLKRRAMSLRANANPNFNENKTFKKNKTSKYQRLVRKFKSKARKS